jgi:hypothetical protein
LNLSGVDWAPAWLWMAVVASGLYHGVNPGMGWPLAVSAGLMERSSRALIAALWPLMVGHLLAMLLVLLPFLTAGREPIEIPDPGFAWRAYYEPATEVVRNLLFRKATALHALVLVLGQSELQTGLGQRGKVTISHRKHAGVTNSAGNCW